MTNNSKSRRLINSRDDYITIQLIDETNLVDHIPPCVYRVDFEEGKMVLIKDRAKFTVPPKVFGKHNLYMKAITEKYDPLGKMLGVMLFGKPGSGKSLLAESLGNWMLTQDIPVILINKSFTDQALDTIASLVGPCMFFFDEFEKVYSDKEHRDQLLPFFSSTKHLGILSVITGNDREALPSPLLDRPQRFYFRIPYQHGVDKAAADEVLTFMKIDEKFHEALHVYIKNEEVNMDVFLNVVRMTAGLSGPDDLIELVSILNVPNFPAKKTYANRVVNQSELNRSIADNVAVTISVTSLYDGMMHYSISLKRPKNNLDESDSIGFSAMSKFHEETEHASIAYDEEKLLEDRSSTVVIPTPCGDAVIELRHDYNHSRHARWVLVKPTQLERNYLYSDMPGGMVSAVN